MATTMAPPLAVDGPFPAAPPGGLVTHANIIPNGEGRHFLGGVAVWPYPDLTQAGVWNPCSTGSTRVKDSGDGFAVPEFGSFAIYETITCTARSIGAIYDEDKTRALAALAAVQSALIEREFALGDANPLQPHLTDPNADVRVAGAQTADYALQWLENALAETGKQGLIHADPATAVAWAKYTVAEWRGDRLYSTGTGTPIVVGRGYLGAVPDGEAALSADQSWAFVTGPVDLRWDEPVVVPETISQALDRAQNVVELRAERYCVIDWDAVLQGAVLIDRNA